MAKNDSRQNDQATPRVYKANAVHKRRASRKIPAEGSVRIDAPEEADELETVASEAPGMPDASDAPALETAPEVNAIAPESGFSERESSEGEIEGIRVSKSESNLSDETPRNMHHGDLRGESDYDQSESPDDERPADVSDSLDDAHSEASKPPKRKKVRLRTIILTVLAVIIVIAVAAVSLFAWNRWGRYNDAEDFKGTWYVQGTAVPVTVDDSLIHLADNVAYTYAIDERDKTISYTFGDWKGQGRYWFSDDRSTLIITDGSDFTGAGNTADDFAKMLDELKPGGDSSGADQAQEDGSIALSRTAPTVAFVAQQFNDRVVQEKVAAQEALDEEVYDYYY